MARKEYGYGLAEADPLDACLDRALGPGKRRSTLPRIQHTTIGTIAFCVPRGMKVQRTAGFEGDIHNLITISSKSETAQLNPVLPPAYPFWALNALTRATACCATM